MTRDKRNFMEAIGKALNLSRKKDEARWRIDLCEGPNCCTPEESKEAWVRLKSRIKERGLDHGPGWVACSRTECLGVCGDGPIAVVNPGRTWYAEMNPDRIEHVIEEHFMKGRPVEAYAFDPPPDAHDPC